MIKIKGKQIDYNQISYEHLEPSVPKKIYNLRKELVSHIINCFEINSSESFDVTEYIYTNSPLRCVPTIAFDKIGCLLSSYRYTIIDDDEKIIGKGKIENGKYINGLENYHCWFRKTQNRFGLDVNGNEVIGEIYSKEYSSKFYQNGNKYEIISISDESNYGIIVNPYKPIEYYANQIVASWDGDTNLHQSPLGYITNVEQNNFGEYKVFFKQKVNTNYVGRFRLYKYYISCVTPIYNELEKKIDYYQYIPSTSQIVDILYLEVISSDLLLPSIRNYYDLCNFYKIIDRTTIVSPTIQYQYEIKKEDLYLQEENYSIFNIPAALAGTVNLYIDGVKIFRGTVPHNNNQTRRYIEITNTNNPQVSNKIKIYNVKIDNLVTEELFLTYIPANS